MSNIIKIKKPFAIVWLLKKYIELYIDLVWMVFFGDIDMISYYRICSSIVISSFFVLLSIDVLGKQ
jgi:hypothetical protein